MRYLFCIAVIALLCSCQAKLKPPVDYPGFIKGHKLAEMCGEQSTDGKTACVAYIFGSIDTEASIRAEIGESPYCRSFSPKDAVNTVISYMRANQEKLSYPGGRIVYAAMDDAYGCAEE